MKRSVFLIWMVIMLTLSACKQQGSQVVTYPLQDDRALVGVFNSNGEMAYMIVNCQNEVISYIHLTDIRLDTIYREGKLAFQHSSSGQKGYIDLDGHVIWEEQENEEANNQTTSEQPAKEQDKKINTNNWQAIIKQNPFYEEAKKTFASGLEESDKANRQMILDYVEQLRQSYGKKDISFIEQVFSDNALIITGKVIREVPSESNSYLPKEKVTYNIRSKQQFLTKLKQVFNANHKIELLFSDFKINRHPTIPTIYGVSLRQTYTSDIYADDGYLFLLWDFKDADVPQIHVRTWQPRILDDQTVIPENEIFSLRNFNLK